MYDQGHVFFFIETCNLLKSYSNLQVSHFLQIFLNDFISKGIRKICHLPSRTLFENRSAKEHPRC